VAGFSLLIPDGFLRVGTVQAMMFQLPELGILSLAMVIPLISGGINLSIIATTNQAALVMAWILTEHLGADASAPMVGGWIAAALVAGCALCLVIGLVNGLFVAVLGVHPILVTLGTMTLVQGMSIFLTRGRTISGLPEPLLVVSNGTLCGVPISFVLFLALVGAVHVFLTRSPLGIRIHLVGSNAEATRFSGVDTRRVLISAYVLSGLLCWLAAIVMMARFNSAGADFAQSYLLITILAAVLGGIDPYGGFGRVPGLLVSLAILQTISTGFNVLGLSAHLTLALWGVTLLVVIAVKRAAAGGGTRQA
jgi:simple sugar transport system permease protein